MQVQPISSQDEYRVFAPVYDLLLSPVLDPMRKRVCQIVLAQKTKSLIELCCGTGRQCILLQRLGVKTAGVDSSASMLRQALRKSPPDIDYRLEDAGKTSFSQASFDSALLSLALHEKPFTIQINIVKEAIRLVKPAGSLILVDYIQPQGIVPQVINPFISLIELLAGKKHAHCYKQFMAMGALNTYPLDRLGWTRAWFEPVCFKSMGIAVYRQKGNQIP